MALGSDQQLYILAFDHRWSPHRDLLRVGDPKSVVFDGFARVGARSRRFIDVFTGAAS